MSRPILSSKFKVSETETLVRESLTLNQNDKNIYSSTNLFELFLGIVPGDSLFTYLFRRFGVPNAYSDDYKQLAVYKLKTHVQGVFLEICPKPNPELSKLQFNVLIPEGLSIQFNQYMKRPRVEYSRRRDQWIFENIPKPDWMDALKESIEKDVLNNIIPYMCVTGQPADWIPKDWRELIEYCINFQFFEEGSLERSCFNWYKEMCAQYEQVEARPFYSTSRNFDWESWSDEDPMKQFVLVIKKICEDLKRPVAIRDTQIDIYGPTRKKGRMVERSDYAGWNFGELNQHPELFRDLIETVINLGNGDTKKGIKRTLQALNGVTHQRSRATGDSHACNVE